MCPWCVCAECVSLWGVPSPVCAPQHGQCAPKGTADPFGGLKDRRTRLLHAADGQHRTPRVYSARTRVGMMCTHSVRESVDAVAWSEGGVSKQTPIHKINVPVFFPFHSVLLQCCWLASTALCVLHCRRSVECVTPFPSCVCEHTPVREHPTRSGRGWGCGHHTREGRVGEHTTPRRVVCISGGEEREKNTG